MRENHSLSAFGGRHTHDLPAATVGFDEGVLVIDGRNRMRFLTTKDDTRLYLLAAEPVDAKEAIEGSIRGMLQVLDPHSNYLDPRTYQSMRARQEGSFFGVGIIMV